MKLTNHKKGSHRDRELYSLLESQVALNTEQIWLLLFKNNCKRIVQRRLKKLVENKKISRFRVSLDESYVYYVNRKPGQLEHVLGVSWAFTWINLTLNSMEKLHCFDREVKDYKLIRPDAFVGIKNLWFDSYSFYFIEIDIVESGNDFSLKVKKYQELYNSESYVNMWWVPLSKRFPVIIVITTGRVKTIQEKINKENVNGLEFRIYSLDQVKEVCLNGSSSISGLRA